MSNEYKNNEIDYAKNLEEKILHKRLSRTTISVIELGQLLVKFKKEKLFLLLGYKNFAIWYTNWGFPYQSINHWIRLYLTYVNSHGLTKADLKNVEVRVLKDLLPVMNSPKASKEKLLKVLNHVKSMNYKDFREILPSIKTSFGIGSK